MKTNPKGAGKHPDEKSALLLGDIQVDFCPGGALAVPGGDEIIPVINEYIRLFHARGLPIVATRDWHPPNHCSFKENGGPWPVHCVQGSRGAQFHPKLILPPGTLIISKATDPKKEAYSSFEGTPLEERLRELGVETLYVSGLATDYCVKHTVLDACRIGLRVVLLEDAIRGIDATPGDCARAIAEMRQAGAIPATARDLGVTVP
ncbi:nicotinamidase [Nitrospira sp. Kam-Ns4a]